MTASTPDAHRGTALVRRPGPRLAEGIVTHRAPTEVDLDLARAQHARYCQALAGHGWRVHEVSPADDHPDAVFVEDTLVVIGDLAVLTRPGAPQRRGEVSGTAAAVRELGLRMVKVAPPGELDGGDVLQVGELVYVGVGGRTSPAGVAALREAARLQGRRVVPVALRGVLHLKSAVTALPDGSLIGRADQVDAKELSPIREPPEEGGSHVVPLGGDTVLLAASAPRTAALLERGGYDVEVVDIGEFEKLEGCVTCLSVLIPDPAS